MLSAFLGSAIILGVCLGGAVGPRILAAPSAGIQFLFDDESIDRTVGVRRELAQPVKDPEPLLNRRVAWEAGSRELLGVIFDEQEKKFKMWYQVEAPALEDRAGTGQRGGTTAEPSERESADRQKLICYAESLDGRNWSRPELGMVEFAGSKRNNILAKSGSEDGIFFSILKDPSDPNPLRRYKAAGYVNRTTKSLLRDRPSGGGGFVVAFSADGLNWPKEGLLVMDKADVTDCDMVLPVRDPIRGKWIVFMRPRTKPKRRYIGYSESADFEHWTYPQMLISPDAGDSEFLEFYGLAARPLAGWYVGGVWAFYNNPAWSPMSNELVYSADGLRYRRAFPGQAWIPAGPRGSFDSVMLMPRSIIDRGAEILIYYSGTNGTHGSDRTRGSTMSKSETLDHEPRRDGIGVARLPWGHFAGYRADREGMVETKWLTNYGSGAAVTAIAALDRGGAIQAEILDQYGNAIPGWTREVSGHRVDAANHNELAFFWGSEGLVGRAGQRSPNGGTIGHVVKLRFYLRQAALYGFQLVPEAKMPGYSR